MVPPYTIDELKRALLACGLSAGDVVSLQVSLGRLGRPAMAPFDMTELANAVIDCFLDVIGPAGTLVVPSYTYSFGRGETFDVDHTPSAIGELPDIFRARYGVRRSRDPMLSHAAIGPATEAIVGNIPRTCFGPDSVFDRLRRHDAKICTLGVSLYFATFLHHIEEFAEVPFRFRKPFRGTIRENGIDHTETWLYFAAPQGVPNCKKDPLPLERAVRQAGIVSVAPVGRGEVMVVEARKYFDEGIRQLAMNPWLTAAGPPIPIESFVSAELAAAGTGGESPESPAFGPKKGS